MRQQEPRRANCECSLDQGAQPGFDARGGACGNRPVGEVTPRRVGEDRVEPFLVRGPDARPQVSVDRRVVAVHAGPGAIVGERGFDQRPGAEYCPHRGFMPARRGAQLWRGSGQHAAQAAEAPDQQFRQPPPGVAGKGDEKFRHER